MRHSRFISLSFFGTIVICGLLFTSCGSFQNSSYYSDGIYNSDNVIVIRRNKKAPTNNSYTQYFDQQSKQYNWDNNTNDVALTNVDSLNQGNLNNYQSNPNWGGGNKTTQIVIQSSPLVVGGFGNLGFGGLYDPYVAYWNQNYYNPYYWDRFAWGFNRPFFNGHYPYYRYGFYGNPYFQGGFWNPYGYGYAYNYRNNRPINRYNKSNNTRARSNRAYSSSYRGQAAGGDRTAITRREVQGKNSSPSLVNGNGRDANATNANQAATRSIPQGRTANVRQTQNINDTQRRVSRTQNTQLSQNSSQIDRVIRKMQSNGFEIQVVNDAAGARRYSQQNQARNIVNSRGQNTQTISRNNNTNSVKEYSSSKNSSNNSSSRSSNTNVNRNSSRSYSAPARVSSGGGRSSSSGRSSSGRSSSGGRRQ